MNVVPIDLGLLCGVALIVGIGLFRGLSGELASLAGFVAAIAAGYSLYGFAHGISRALGFDKGDTTELVAAGVAVFVLGLVVFGLTRLVIDKFVSFLVPQPTNALLGALSGIIKSFALLCLLAGVGFMRPGTYAQGEIAKRSQVIHALAEWLDSFYADGEGKASDSPGTPPDGRGESSGTGG